jgi:hypothetical protein
MSNRFTQSASRVFFWTFQRGTWQYDILCAIILAFIFLTPNSVFHGYPFVVQEEPKMEEKEEAKPGSQASYPVRESRRELP